MHDYCLLLSTARNCFCACCSFPLLLKGGLSVILHYTEGGQHPGCVVGKSTFWDLQNSNLECNHIACWFEHWTLRASQSVNLVFQIIHEPPPPVSDESSVSSAFISHPNGFEYWGKNKETRSHFYNVGKSGHRWEGSASSGMFFGLNICLISHSNYFKTVTNVQVN